MEFSRRAFSENVPSIFPFPQRLENENFMNSVGSASPFSLERPTATVTTATGFATIAVATGRVGLATGAAALCRGTTLLLFLLRVVVVLLLSELQGLGVHL